MYVVLYSIFVTWAVSGDGLERASLVGSVYYSHVEGRRASSGSCCGSGSRKQTHCGFHGAIVAFDPANDDWSEYVERLEHYFTANDIVEGDKQSAILLNAVGASTYRLRSFVSPSKVTDFSFAELVEKAQVHFIIKRYEFNTRC